MSNLAGAVQDLARHVGQKPLWLVCKVAVRQMWRRSGSKIFRDRSWEELERPHL
jgi:hypothetical protein